jgi:hypothetical protein
LPTHPEEKNDKGREYTLTSAAVAAFGAASLCMLPVLGALVSPTHNAVYHLAGPASALFVPALCNLFFLAFVLTLLLSFAKPSHRFGVLVWSAFLFFMPWIVLKGVSTLYQLAMPHRVSLTVFFLCTLCVLVSVGLWTPSRAHSYTRGLRFGSAALGLAAIFGAILTIQAVWFGWQARHLNDPAYGAASSFAPAPPASGTTPHPLVLWVVFDELSHDQLFDSRAPGLSLPNFDRFASQSTVFTRTIPAGIYTELVFPALMTSVDGDAIRVSSNGLRVQLHVPGDDGKPSAWQTFDQHQTVFADAQEMGYRTAIAGWYNPYCRILPSVLTSCFWTGESALSAMFPARTIHENLFHPAIHLLQDIPNFFFPRRAHVLDQGQSAQLHIDDLNDVTHAADRTLADPSLDFVLLHLPIPHPDGIYDRKHHRLTTGYSTYIDNLALADEYLGHIRQILEQQNRWNSATVLVMGDHSWRTQLLWTKDPRWSTEEQRASHNGKFDDRPFYALKLPGQTTAAQITQPYRANRTKALLDALLLHKINTPEQLAQDVAGQQ